jgi:hypothetical protein
MSVWNEMCDCCGITLGRTAEVINGHSVGPAIYCHDCLPHIATPHVRVDDYTRSRFVVPCVAHQPAWWAAYRQQRTRTEQVVEM